MVQSGEIELFIEIDQMPFVIERLGSGAVLNSRNFFFEAECFEVNVRCSKGCNLLFLYKRQIERLMTDHLEFRRAVLIYINQLIKSKKRLMIDATLNYHSRLLRVSQREVDRRIRLKNVVLQII